jgi:hypothetical protein
LEGNIKVKVKEILWSSLECIHLAEEREQ